MNVPFARPICFRWVTALLLLLLAAPSLRAAEMKLEAQLIWGTNDEKAPNSKHKEVDPVVEKKLRHLPFRWKNYFEITRKTMHVDMDASEKITLSKECDLEVKNLGDNQLEVSLYGRGKLVSRIKQKLPEGELLVTGGNAENLTAWFVVLRQM